MELNGFKLFAFFLCSALLGALLSAWATMDLVTDREISLILVVFAAVAFTLLSQISTSDAVHSLISCRINDVQDKQVADINEAHRRHITTLKYDHQTLVHELQGSLNTANVKFNRIYHDHDWMSGMYQEQFRLNQEQEDRITYLEGKLKEFGQLTPDLRTPFSAPATRIHFSVPPRRDHGGSPTSSSAMPNPLSQVEAVEAEEE